MRIEINLHSKYVALRGSGLSFWSNCHVKITDGARLELPRVFAQPLRKYTPKIFLRPSISVEVEPLPPENRFLVIEPLGTHLRSLKSAKKLPQTTQETVINSYAQTKFDGQGRLIVPERMLYEINFKPGDKLVALGMVGWIEIWKEADWKRWEIELQNSPEWEQLIEFGLEKILYDHPFRDQDSV